MWRWIRMLFTRRNRRGPSRDAAAANLRADQSREVAEQNLRDARKLREVAEEAEAAVRGHNVANHYAVWLRDQLRD